MISRCRLTWRAEQDLKAIVIFYLRRTEGIDIIGVLHQRMDVMHYFWLCSR